MRSRSVPRRNRTTDGSCSRRSASSVPKSVSAEMRMRTLSRRAVEDLLVARRLQSVVAHVHRVVTGGPQLLRPPAARARCRSEISTGGERELALPYRLSCVAESLLDVGWF